ncbi:MAG TPA: SDR family oxidoreductase [Mycobacteriales bacterium]|nr:SDR family oxidoreductase [Mycobacteriales bacterium]
MPNPRTALITGAGRKRSMGTAMAQGLAADGWDLVLNYWHPYDDRLGQVRGPNDVEELAEECRRYGRRVTLVPADLSDPDAPQHLVTRAAQAGNLEALVMSHCESVDSSILTTTVESWDRHFAVNARAVWLLIKAFAEQLPVQPEDARCQIAGRIIALTSDHTTHNLPYGASKGALDRIVIASAQELADRGIRANVINPGPVDTGWMSDEIRASALQQTPAGRAGTAEDTANLVRFLLSEQGNWIDGQLLFSNGGFRMTGGG